MGNDASKSRDKDGVGVSSGSAPLVPVILNVYEPSVGSRGLPGFSILHSGIEVFDTEYTFAGNESSMTGVVTQRPRDSPQGWTFKQSEKLGSVALTKQEAKQLIGSLAGSFPGNSYHLTAKNCNHFTEAVCKKMGLSFPSWINRAAKVGNVMRKVVGDSALAGAAGAAGGGGSQPVAVSGDIAAVSIDGDKVGCLNASKDHPVTNLPSIRVASGEQPLKSKKGAAAAFLESDCDDQVKNCVDWPYLCARNVN